MKTGFFHSESFTRGCPLSLRPKLRYSFILIVESFLLETRQSVAIDCSMTLSQIWLKCVLEKWLVVLILVKVGLKLLTFTKRLVSLETDLNFRWLWWSTVMSTSRYLGDWWYHKLGIWMRKSKQSRSLYKSFTSKNLKLDSFQSQNKLKIIPSKKSRPAVRSEFVWLRLT